MRNKISRSKFIANYKLLQECRDKRVNIKSRVANSIMVIYDLLLLDLGDDKKKVNKSVKGLVFLIDGDWYRVVDIFLGDDNKLRFRVCYAYSTSRGKFDFSLSDISLNNRENLYWLAFDVFNYLVVGTSPWRKICGKDNYNLHFCLNVISIAGVERSRTDMSYSYSLDLSNDEYCLCGDDVSRFDVSVDLESEDMVKFQLINADGKEIKADDLALSFFIHSFVNSY